MPSSSNEDYRIQDHSRLSQPVLPAICVKRRCEKIEGVSDFGAVELLHYSNGIFEMT
jgi:hypothetical protein